MALLEQGVKAISNFFGGEDTTLRERLLDPNNEEILIEEEPNIIRQPEPEPKETYEDLDEFELDSITDDDDGDFFDPWEGETFDLEVDQRMKNNAKLQEQMYGDLSEGLDNQSLGVMVTKEAARKDIFEDLKMRENADKKGLVSTPTGNKFMPFESIEGEGPDSGMSKFEIGYGIKIPKAWLGDDKSKWPVVEDVPVNVKEGMSEDKVLALSETLLEDSYNVSSEKLNKWDDMTEMEKGFWADLTHNGGHRAINKNPEAMKAANAGRTVEGMVLALDFIKYNDKPSRGLLNRRLSRYNQAALERTGVPVVESYKFGKDIEVKFGSSFMTDKISDKLANKIKNNDGWLKISTGGDDDKVWEVDDDFKFKE